MDSLILQLGVALAIGLLVGLERGWHERDAPKQNSPATSRNPFEVMPLMLFALLFAFASTAAVALA
ncbi:MgtC/SapB family protein [Mesorhizobium sp. CA14]|uniref:MgtC/SapB family protein n=1 Tax=Mesorhizobium sp. CA14 TaxID=2876642 RepID=UPI0021E278AA|nr:MgtC/SapB family protein [Mesorhizobium sp. CA14]